MNTGVKIILYVVLIIATIVSGIFFFKNFGKLFEQEKPIPAVALESAPAPAPTVIETNNVPTNEVATNIQTNAPATNAVAAAADTNAPVETNIVAEVPSPPPPPAVASAAPPARKSRIGFWTGAFILCVIALGGLIAWDFSSYMGSKTLKVIYNDDGPGFKSEEYDAAEKVWANGQPLDAVRMFRDYLNKNPREVHVALRIAEIYEKDLNNFLAAALEYEEVLKKKLPDERWGWAAIHLCNLYFKLGQEMKGYALLQRIVKEYGQTQAAEKARKRLKEVDPNLLEEAEPSQAAPQAAPEPEEPKSNLPPGFRPKK